jgi:hypothetical protein
MIMMIEPYLSPYKRLYEIEGASNKRLKKQLVIRTRLQMVS